MFSSSANLPTDNVYKFLAIFGLLLVFFGGYIFNSSLNSFNEQYIKLILEKSELEGIKTLNDHVEMEKKVVDKKIELLKSNKPFHSNFSGFLVVFGFVTMLFGFHRWFFYLQPKLNQLLELEIEKSKLEIEAFNKVD
ncbi:hypothetical protein A6D98_02990 [Aliivibrio fischeri]|nr:hypothetical protein [Aliivibrio fischeri]OCH01841.1 hypothetical protein A6E09_18675 [Aliivibrio fischeri]OCH56935.1 hypothetical protein A6D98_02990 [Aliivibrio fischeri]